MFHAEQSQLNVHEASHIDESRPRYENFFERAGHEPNPAVASDLYFSAHIAQNVAELGGLALVVGGFVRDTVIARNKNELVAAKDIDVEVYGLAFDELVTALS